MQQICFPIFDLLYAHKRILCWYAYCFAQIHLHNLWFSWNGPNFVMVQTIQRLKKFLTCLWWNYCEVHFQNSGSKQIGRMQSQKKATLSKTFVTDISKNKVRKSQNRFEKLYRDCSEDNYKQKSNQRRKIINNFVGQVKPWEGGGTKADTHSKRF